MKKFFLFFGLLLSYSIALGEGNDKTIIEYFADNYFIQLLVYGGYYTLGLIVVLVILSIMFKNFLKIILSVMLAIFGFLLFIFVFQSLDNIEWIPSS